jgi:hypothetical protein
VIEVGQGLELGNFFDAKLALPLEAIIPSVRKSQ